MTPAVNRRDPDLLSQIEEYYDRCWVPRFERGHNPESHAMHFGYYEAPDMTSEEAKLRLNEYLIRRLGLGATAEPHLLDAGCGVGGTAVHMARAYRGARIVAVNISPQQLQLARRFACRAGVDDQIELIRGSYLETDLPAAAFDAVYAIESLCHCTDRGRFAAEARRLLRPGGRLGVIDFFRTSATLDSDAERSAYEEVKRGFRLPDYYELPLAQVAEGAGLVRCRLDDITAEVGPGLERSARRARQLLPELGRSADSEPFAAHLKACVGLWTLTRTGALIYAGFTATKPAGSS